MTNPVVERLLEIGSEQTRLLRKAIETSGMSIHALAQAVGSFSPDNLSVSVRPAGHSAGDSRQTGRNLGSQSGSEVNKTPQLAYNKPGHSQLGLSPQQP